MPLRFTHLAHRSLPHMLPDSAFPDIADRLWRDSELCSALLSGEFAGTNFADVVFSALSLPLRFTVHPNLHGLHDLFDLVSFPRHSLLDTTDRASLDALRFRNLIVGSVIEDNRAHLLLGQDRGRRQTRRHVSDCFDKWAFGYASRGLKSLNRIR